MFRVSSVSGFKGLALKGPKPREVLSVRTSIPPTSHFHQLTPKIPKLKGNESLGSPVVPFCSFSSGLPY